MSTQADPVTETPEFPYTADQIVSQYIKLRDTVKKISERHAKEIEPYTKAMEALADEAARMMRHLKTTLSTDSGSAFWTPREQFKVVDINKFRMFVLTTNEWRMTTNHVSKDGIRDWREEQIKPDDWPADVEWVPPVPPGIEYNFEQVVQFRKG